MPDGEVLRPPSRKSAALLAYVSDQKGTIVPRETIADLLWRRSGAEHGRASLRQELAVLRKSLGALNEEVIASARAGLAFASDNAEIDTQVLREVSDRTDTAGIDALSEAFSLYSHPFLQGLRVNSDGFDDWAESTRVALEDRAVRVGRAILDHWVSVGDTGKVIETGQRLIEIDPTLEAAHVVLMDAFWRDGDKARALKQYKYCCDVMLEHLDVDASPETKALAEKITNGPASEMHPSVTQPRPDVRPRSEEKRLVCILSISGGVEAEGPDEFEAECQAFAEVVSKVAEKFAAAPFQQSGDQIHVCFGFPGMSEFDADHAVHAAHKIGGDWAAVTGGVVKAGVSRGEVIISSTPGSGGPPEISGPAIRQAGRLRRDALQGQIIIDDAAAAATSASVAKEPLEDRQAHLARHVGSFPGSFLDASDKTPFTGRQGEFRRLVSMLDRARTDGVQIAAVTGAPGMGKSRLAREVAKQALSQGFRVFSFFGDPHNRETVFAPLTGYLKSQEWFREADHSQARELALRTWIRSEAGSLIGSEAYYQQLLRPERQEASFTATEKEDALGVFAALASAGSQNAPRMLIFEDLHWYEPTTLAAVQRLIDSPGNGAALALLLCREGETPKFIDHPSVQRIRLEGLLENEASDLLRSALEQEGVSAMVLADVARRAAGNPLFLEEFARSIDGAEPETTGEAHAKSQRVWDHVQIPAALGPLMLSRFDSISGAVRLLQCASVLGDRFRLSHLVSVGDFLSETPEATLRELEDADVLFSHSRASGEYMFKHALIQELMYATIPKRNLPDLHQRAALCLEAEPSGESPAVIARHFATAEMPEKAIQYYELAGDEAVRVSAPKEAVAHYSAALDAIREFPEAEFRVSLEPVLIRKTAAQMISVRGIATSEVDQHYRDLWDLGERLGDADETANAAWGLWSRHLVAGQMARCEAIASSLHDAARHSQNPATQMISIYMTGVTQTYCGGLRDAEANLRTVLGIYRPQLREELKFRFGMDIGLTANCFLSWACALQGKGELADAATASASALCSEIDNGFSAAFVHVFTANKALFLGRREEAENHAKRALAISRDQGFQQWSAQAQIQLARVAAMTDAADAPDRLRAALDEYMASESVLARPYAQVWLAEALLCSGKLDQALEEIEALEEFFEATGERYFEAEAYRVKHKIFEEKATTDPTSEAQSRLAIANALRLAEISGYALSGT